MDKGLLNFECLFARIVSEQRDTLPTTSHPAPISCLEGYSAALRRQPLGVGPSANAYRRPLTNLDHPIEPTHGRTRLEFKDYCRPWAWPATPRRTSRKPSRKLARKYPPDVSKEPDAETRMKEVNESYAVLSGSGKTRRL